MKVCRVCGESKPLSEFHRNKSTKDGLQSRCKACAVAYTARWQKENRERLNATRRARYVRRSTEDIRAKERAYARERRSRWTPEQRAQRREVERRAAFKKKYGISVDQYDGLVAAQSGLCRICGRMPAGRRPRLYVDHCHNTSAIRGLLCSNCNSALGLFREDPEVLRAAIDYLQRGAVASA